jgi:hypothetical protein
MMVARWYSDDSSRSDDEDDISSYDQTTMHTQQRIQKKKKKKTKRLGHAPSNAVSGKHAPQIFTHHIEIPISGAAAALSFGEKELASALDTMARYFTIMHNIVFQREWMDPDNAVRCVIRT